MRRFGLTLRGRTTGFIVFLAFICFCLSLANAQTQQTKKVFRLGYLTASSAPLSAPVHVAFMRGLNDLGYVQGQNLIIEHRKAEGDADRLPDLATELVHLPVDILVATGSEPVLRAASQATRTIPIVTMAVNYDPVAKGYIDSLARPGGNITGGFFMQLVLSAKRLEILKKALPQVTRVFALYDAHSADQLPATEAAAQSLGLQLQSLELRDPPYDYESAMVAAVRAQAQALVVLSSPLFYHYRTQIAALTVKHRLPSMFLFGFYAAAGGLMSYGVNMPDMYRSAATYVDNILKGANPADLPVKQPTKFELVINLKTAEQIGVTIPPVVLFQADKVMQ
jgi:putative ABC transport system substrate-binding protein